MIGKLKWIDQEYEVVTGGYGLGAIPNGIYVIEKKHAAVGDSSNMDAGYIDAKTNDGWFLPLTPKFSTDRHGFGLHPDGNLPGTKGCLGLQGEDADKFWRRWIKTPMVTKPSSLVVTSEIARS